MFYGEAYHTKNKFWKSFGFIAHTKGRFLIPPLKKGLQIKQCLVNIFWVLCLKAKHLESTGRCLLVISGQKSRSNCWSLFRGYLLNIFDPFAWKLPNLVHQMPLGSRWLLLIFRSHGQKSRLNCWSLKKWCFFNISWPLCLEEVP